MGRRPCCSKDEGLNRGAWTAIEDRILTDYIKTHGEGSWRNLPKRAGLKRCGKSCRLRWLNYLRPDIKRGNITMDEEDLIVRLHKLLGNRWSLIAGRLPGRTDNEIKNYWNTNLSKKLHLYNHHRHHLIDDGSPKSAACRKRRITAVHCTTSNLLPMAVRTKAVHCTRVFIDPIPPAAHHQQPKLPHPTISNTSVRIDIAPQRVEGGRTTAADFILDRGDQGVQAGMTGCRLADPKPPPPENHDLVVDSGGIEEFGNQLDLDNVCFGNNNYDDTLSNTGTMSPEHPLLFSDDMFEDWTRTNVSALDASGAGDVDDWLSPLI